MKSIRLFLGMLILGTGIMACHPAHTMTRNNSRQQIPGITERYWKLTTIGGKPLQAGQYNREPHIILKAGNSRVTGSGGCNTFNGSYVMSSPDKVTFAHIAMTMMACPGDNIEHQLLQVLESSQHYLVQEDTLSLYGARKELLARFEAVYLH